MNLVDLFISTLIFKPWNHYYLCLLWQIHQLYTHMLLHGDFQGLYAPWQCLRFVGGESYHKVFDFLQLFMEC